MSHFIFKCAVCWSALITFKCSTTLNNLETVKITSEILFLGMHEIKICVHIISNFDAYMVHRALKSQCVETKKQRVHMGLDAKKKLWGFVNNKGADQPAGMRSWSAPLLFPFSKVQNLNLLQVNFNFLASLLSWGDWFECHFVGNSLDRICCIETHMQYTLLLFVCLFCCFTSQVNSFFMARRSVHLTTLFPGQAWTSSQPVLCAHTFACNWQQPFLNDSAEGRRMTVINLHKSMGPGWDPTRDPWICSQTRICCQTCYRLRYAARYTHSYL